MRDPRGSTFVRSMALRRARHTHNVVTVAAVFLIRCYQAMIRPFLIGACKFHPTCSEYAIEAFYTHGPWRGSILAVRRLVRCHPFSPGGIDPVPEKRNHQAQTRGDDVASM
jgi:putative membrane protein insertion efficiency factor